MAPEAGTPGLSAKFDAERLLRPRTIAAIGGSAAAETIRQCRRMSYAGEIWPVHPRKAEVEGLPAYASVADLPGAPDAAFVGVNRQATVEVVRALARRGAGGAVCYASGFRESGGDGDGLQDALLAAAGDMPVLGPNTYGLINYLDGALLWPDQHGGIARARGVALIAQSSNIAINLTMTRRALPLAYMVTLGNQAQLGVSDLIPALAADRRVSAIGLLLEGFDDAARFAEAAATAHAAGVPLVALKAGQSDEGRGLALSHTASLGGSAQLASAFLQRHGVGEVHSLSALLETLKLLHAGGPLAGADVAALSSSGGEAILTADAGAGRQIRFRAFTPDQHAVVRATVHDLVTVSNPMDYHTFMWGDAKAMTETFATVMQARFDLTLTILDLPRGDRCDDTLWRPSMEALLAAQARTGARAALVATLPDGLPEDVAERCLAHGVAPLVGLEDALTAVEVAAFLGRPRPDGRPAAPVAARAAPAGNVHTLDEPAAKAELAAHGVPMPEARRVPADPEAAAAAADAVGYPVVLKAVVPDLAHKTEAGGVILNLRDAAAVRGAAQQLARLGGELLVEAMLEDGVAELIVGYRHDPVLGAFLVLGSGGLLVELVGDSAVVPLPVERAEAAAALDSLKVAHLLDGFRGQPPGDRAALLDAVEAIGRYCCARVDELEELEVNPLIVRPDGCAAADALIRRRPANTPVTAS